ncbi:MAG: matrixin family metalloprotease [Vampirovibrionales bacterium]|nr:matrixin family metalloprotease [Vampirovibrionales bacterium]
MFSTSVQAGNFESGLAAYQQRQYSIAIPLLRAAVADDPNDPNRRYYLADALLKNNNIGEAQLEYARILEIAPDTQAGRFSRVALANITTYALATNQKWQLGSTQATGSSKSDRLLGVSAGGDSYIDEVTDGGQYVRWSMLMPLKVYVERSPRGISHFQPGFVSTISQAMETWKRALGGQLNFMMVPTADQADIKVEWVNSIDEHGFTKDNVISFTAGLTSPLIQSNILKEMRVRVATLDIQKRPQDQEGIYRTVVHELGHALGLLGHSTKKGDLMYVQNNDVSTLTTRDINTIRRLYTEMPDVSNRPPSSGALADLNSADRQQRIAEAVDTMVEKNEAQVKTLPNALSYINLGVAYIKKAENLKTQKKLDKTNPQNQPNYWYLKAIDAYGQSLVLEPDNMWALTRRATVYQDMKQPEKALADVNHAIKTAPKEADLYLQQAQVLVTLERKPEAANAFNKFKALAPNAANSPTAKLVEKSLK